MTGTRARRNHALVTEAIRLTGVRAVVATGWGGIGAATRDSAPGRRTS